MYHGVKMRARGRGFLCPDAPRSKPQSAIPPRKLRSLLVPLVFGLRAFLLFSFGMCCWDVLLICSVLKTTRP